MDHVVQIPGVGPEWEDIPESTTALAFLAAATERVQLGALVNGITEFISVDVEATLRSYDRLEKMAGGLTNVIPGHDPLILKRYPAWKPETAGTVHKLDAPRIG